MHKSHRVMSLLPGRKHVLIGLMPLILSGCASQSGNWFDTWGKCALSGGVVGAAGGATSSGSAAALGGGIGLLLGGTICALTYKEPEPVVIEEHVEIQPEPAPIIEETMPPERLESVYFLFDSTKIEAASAEVLESAAKTLNEFPHINLTVTGYTDATGPASYNDKLSVRRAESVKQYLVKEKGFSSSRIKTFGLGELKTNNETREDRAHNRRVELELFSSGTPSVRTSTPVSAPGSMDMEKHHPDAMPPSPPQPSMQAPGQ